MLAACNPLYDAWSGQPTQQQDANFSVAGQASLTHSESATVFFNGYWYLYTRVRYEWQEPGSPTPYDPERYAIGVCKSADGTDFTAAECQDAAGHARIAIQNGPPGLNGASGVACRAAYDMKILKQTNPDRLTMVFGIDPGGSSAATGHFPTPGCSPPERTTPHINGAIGMAYSTDGLTWTGQHRIYQPRDGVTWESGGVGADGRQKGAIGTPTITSDGSHIYIGYHADGTGLNRAVAIFNGSEPLNIGDATPADPSGDLVPPANPMTFYGSDGTTPLKSQWLGGVGEADVMKCSAGTGVNCNGDDGYYMIAEGFETIHVGCHDPNELPQIDILLLRADSPAGPWRNGQHVFLGAHTDCGRDQPSWQYLAPYYRVILSASDQTGLERHSLTNPG